MSETTHIICAHCGGDNEVSNAGHRVGDGTLEVRVIAPKSLVLMFHCQWCSIQYALPLQVYDPF